MTPRSKIILTLSATVVVSLLIGGDIGAHWAAAKIRRQGNPTAWNQSIMKIMQRHLKLTPDQERKVQGHLDDRVTELIGLREETVHRTDAVIEHLIAEVNEELTPQQRVEFAKLAAKRNQTNLDMLKVTAPKR
jgi:hypothetical protein